MRREIKEFDQQNRTFSIICIIYFIRKSYICIRYKITSNMKILKLAIILLLVGCTDNDETTFILQNDLNTSNHFVSLSDVETLCRAQYHQTRGNIDSEFKIKCYKDVTNDTLMYIVNHPNGGWTIYASDTRVPAVLAESSVGTYEEASKNEGLSAWVGTIANDMKTIKHISNNQLNFSSEEIKNNQNFWKSVSNPNDYLKEKNKTRGVGDDIIIPDGHYEFCGSYTYSQVYDTIGRLTKTNWHQNYPYNIYCPFTDLNNGKVPAGCIPVAGAQMLYFLHTHINVPEKAPSKAYCYGNINNYTMWQGDYTTGIWDKMLDPDDTSAAPLVANVGKLLGTVYGNDNSIAYFIELKEKVFPAYGITCKHSVYEPQKLCQSLLNGMPVLLLAFNSLQTRSLKKSNKGDIGVGHSFIADRYKRERKVTVNCYEWVYDKFPNNQESKDFLLPCIRERCEEIYSSPEITMIGFNWGYESYKEDQTQWFSLTGNWIRKRHEDKNWNRDIEMIYDFKIK